jgi:hypothetical protein
MVGAELGRARGEDFFGERLGRVVLLLLPVDDGQVVLGNQRVGVVGAELGRAGGDDLVVERLGPVVPPLLLVEGRQAVLGVLRIRAAYINKSTLKWTLATRSMQPSDPRFWRSFTVRPTILFQTSS